MKSTTSTLLLIAIFFCFSLAPELSTAGEITVNNASGADCSESSNCYTTIAAAVSAATASVGYIDSILVLPGEYTETLDLPNLTITFKGQETARTILYSGITTSAGSFTIKNMTFASIATALSITGSATVNLYNNIFRENDTAVYVGGGTVYVINNVFYNNGHAVYSDVDCPITNNIFMSNNQSITTVSLSEFTQVSYNTFVSNSDTTDWSAIDAYYSSDDPLFVDASTNDFHLQSGSPCIDSGNTLYPNLFDTTTYDRGAYGGSNTDTVPFMVSGIEAETGTSSITLTWSQNMSYLVTGYHVYYGTSSGVYDQIVDVDGATTTTTTVSGIADAADVPDVPVLNQPEIANESLLLSWDAVSGATGYKVYYNIDDGTSSSPTTMIDVGDATSYTLTGLTNNVKYKIALTSYAQTSYYFAVTALDSGGSTFTPGESYESAYSDETSVVIGDMAESGFSNVIIEFPEALVPYPNLPNSGQGCFIATAAYGHYSAPEVQALRDFRDRYLLTNSAGSAFVGWYYAHGPVGAAYLEAHPVFKPLVRAALLPAVGGALFMTRAPLLVKSFVLLFLMGLASMAVYRLVGKRGVWPRRLRLKSSLKKSLFFAFASALLVPSGAYALDASLDQPHWSLELKGGVFAPTLENWDLYYGRSNMPAYAGALAYKLFRQLEVGVGVGTAKDTGQTTAPLHGILAGSVIYTLYPIDVFVLVRGVINENQWLVPYIGGGWTRMYYREKVEGQEGVSGSTDGYHVRGGLQLVLDTFDQSAANDMYTDYGVYHTYFFAEAEKTTAKVQAASVDIGGTAYLAGLLFEF